MADAIFTYPKLPFFSIPKNNYLALELIFVTTVSTLLIWFVQFLWGRRRLYMYARHIPGPPSLPLIGSSFYFMGNSYEIFSNITKMFETYPGIFKVWLGPKLLYAVSEPKHYEILMTKCLAKEALYNKADIIVGKGLFTAKLDTWKKHRKLIAPTFNQKILDSFVEVFSEQSEILVENLKKHAGKGEFDVFHAISTCTLDIICETAMGVKVNAQTTDALYTKWTDRYRPSDQNVSWAQRDPMTSFRDTVAVKEYLEKHELNEKYYKVISDIKLPPKIKTKGRPKGAELTVIGLKRKRTKK